MRLEDSGESGSTFSLPEVLRKRATRGGNATALIFGKEEMSYASLDKESSRVAQALLASGVRPGDRVAFVDRNRPEYFSVLFGAAKVNATTVGVNWRLAPPEMSRVLNDARPRLVIIGSEFMSKLSQFREDPRASQKVVEVGQESKHSGFGRWISQYPAIDPMLPTKGDDTVLQCYTSGTTGTPRGVLITNKSLGVLLLGVAEAWRFDEHSVSLVAMPLFHTSGTVWALIGLWSGARSVILREIEPRRLVETIADHRVTHACLVPSALRMVASEAESSALDLSSLELMLYGGAPITSDLLRRCLRVLDCDLVQGYGLTESVGPVTELTADDHDPDGPRSYLLNSCGRPFPWVDLRVSDPKSGAEVGLGVEGEVWVRSAQTMKGYWNRPEETAEVLAGNGWLRTGDVGYLDRDGYLFLKDRLKDTIISGGENVYPAEVENVLSEHHAIREVAVIGVPHDRWGETVKAFVVANRPGINLSEGEVVRFASEHLARYKCPTSVEFVETLPRNESGKVIRRQLREPYWRGHEGSI